MTFTGFPSRAQSTAIPNAFFTEVLPHLAGDGVAIAVALYAFRALLGKRGSPRFVTADELMADGALTAVLDRIGSSTADIAGGLERVANTGMMLPLCVEAEGVRRTLYFLNTPADRRGMEAVRNDGVELGRVVAPREAGGKPAGIFALYEALAGTLGPGIADELAEAERLYPADWLEAAFREAAAQNVRSWRYVSRILERWAAEGRDDAATQRDPAVDARYFRGKYGRILKQRLKS